MEWCRASVRGSGGDMPAAWRRWRLALMRSLTGQGEDVSSPFPAEWVFSLREGDEDAAVTPSVLEGVQECCLADARRSGTVYTPRFLVRWMVSEALSRWLASRLSACGDASAEREAALLRGMRVLDLSAGAGAFTMGLLHELVCRRKRLQPDLSESALVRMAIEENIYGVDVDAEALEVARFRFRCALLAAGDDSPCRDHLLCGDSLDMSSSGVWCGELAPVMESGGFDLVIGNPPFVGEKGNRELFERLKASSLAAYCSSRMDYWYVFACVGLDALRPGGMMHLVVPNRWLANAGAAPLRRKILKECAHLAMSDFGPCRVFEPARVHTMTLLAEKGPGEGLAPEYRRWCGAPEGVAEFLSNAPYRACNLPPDRMECAAHGLFFCPAGEQAILEKMAALANFALNPAREMAQGIVPNPDVVSTRALESLGRDEARRAGIRRGTGVFVVPCGHFDHLADHERRFLKPLYEPCLADRYRLGMPEKVLLYLTPHNGSEHAETLIRHLERFRSLMDARRENRSGRLLFHHVNWPRRERFFQPGPKILVVRKCARPTFVYTEREAYVMMSFNVIRTERVSMKYLAALFNSRLMHFWFLRRGKMQGDAFQMDTAPVLRAPVHMPGPARVAEAERLADALTAQYSEELDERLNRLVEDVYGLSPEERALVARACSGRPE